MSRRKRVERNVFEALDRAFDSKGGAWCSLGELVDLTGLPERQVRLAVDLWVALGVLRRVRVSGRRVSGEVYYKRFFD